METKIFKVTKDSLDILCKASELLSSGELVAFPTETVYGLGANAYDGEACKTIFSAKGRPSDNPLIVHISKPEDAEKIAYTTPLYYELAKRFMPGPLTVILPKKEVIPYEVTAGLDTVAIRCPKNEVANKLIEISKIPIAAPSANASGKPSPTSAKHVYDDLNGKIPMILDGGDSEFGVESTVITIKDDIITILRPGSVTKEMLEDVSKNVIIASAVKNELKENEQALSPGMKYKHYAPKTRFYLYTGDFASEEAFVSDLPQDVALFTHDEDIERFSSLTKATLVSIGPRREPAVLAHRLFYLLRDADKHGYTALYAPLPNPEGLGLALYNRMIRAAAHNIIIL